MTSLSGVMRLVGAMMSGRSKQLLPSHVSFAADHAKSFSAARALLLLTFEETATSENAIKRALKM